MEVRMLPATATAVPKSDTSVTRTSKPLPKVPVAKGDGSKLAAQQNTIAKASAVVKEVQAESNGLSNSGSTTNNRPPIPPKPVLKAATPTAVTQDPLITQQKTRNVIAEFWGSPEDHPELQCILGDNYKLGRGVAINAQKAFDFYQKAAQQKHPRGEYELGRMYLSQQVAARDPKKFFEWVQKAANQGYPPAEFEMGEIYVGGGVVQKDYKTAAQWYLKAAEKGNDEAQYYLGQMYFEGIGVKQDDQEAFKWFSKAAKSDFSPQFDGIRVCLGKMYKLGRGTKQNYAEALKLFRLCEGDPDGDFNIGVMYAEGLGVKQDYQEALEWLQKAVDCGLGEAQLYLSEMYKSGRGVAKNKEQALSLYSRAEALKKNYPPTFPKR